MSGDERTNGGQHVERGEQLVLTLTRQPWHVQMVLPTAELTLWIAVLRQAQDELEAQLRIARVQQMQQAAADETLARTIMRKQ